MSSLVRRFINTPAELKRFLLASLCVGIAYSIIDSTFNNFLNYRFAMTGFQRSFLELPREIPGMMVVLVSALLSFLCSRRLGGVAMLLGVVGAVLIGFLSKTYAIMLIWLFVYSLGQHLFIPVSSAIGMELASSGKAGRRLGQLNSVRNFAAILGSFLVFLCFKYFGLSFKHTFLFAALGLAVAGFFMFSMLPKKQSPSATHFLKFHKEYRLYYLLSVLFGSRKQIFLTFAPWVLVTVFHQPTQTLATLLTIGGIIGIFFQPALGWATDKLGEKFVLSCEAILLVGVCFGYGFAKDLLPERTAFFLACGCFLLDQMLMSVNMARATYMKKIAKDPSHVQPSLTLSTSLDHVFSIAIALSGGVIWNLFGFQYVFLLGALIALANLFAALRIKLPALNIPVTPLEAVPVRIDKAVNS